MLKILYIGDLNRHGAAYHRYRALTELGHRVIPVNSSAQRHPLTRLATRIAYRLYVSGLTTWSGVPDRRLNAGIISLATVEDFDVLWVDKGLDVTADTLKRFKTLQPACKVVGFHSDDVAVRRHRSRSFLKGLPLYDTYFTTRDVNVTDLERFGCTRVCRTYFSYDKHEHRPMSLSNAQKRRIGGSVGFIGTFERDRAQAIRFLAENGINVRVYGSGWRRARSLGRRVRIEDRVVNGPEYARALCSFDINLCFLRKLNRDQHTQRTFEIPACGCLLLAERTTDHMALFQEGVEAEFFDSRQELLDKVRYYLRHPKERDQMGASGRQRCLRDGHSNHERLEAMLRCAARGSEGTVRKPRSHVVAAGVSRSKRGSCCEI